VKRKPQPLRGLPPPPDDNAPADAWRQYAAELESVIAASEHRAEFLQTRLNQITASPAWKLLRRARAILSTRTANADGRMPDAEAAAPAPEPIRGEPLVSILIPFRDGAKLLARCLDSIRKRTGYKQYEFVLIDNGSAAPATRRLLAREMSKPGVRVLRVDEPFNFARLNNLGAKEARGEHLLLLNNDIEAIEPGWLSALLAYSQQSDVGAAGAKLLYPDGRIQHAGVVMGLTDVAAHCCQFAPGDAPAAQVPQYCAAVTGACLMTRAAVFRDLGGLNDTDLPVAYNDIDYCLRLAEKNLRVVYTPRATLIHHESASRGAANDPREAAYMCRRWAKAIVPSAPST
jgi:GT2 family glycosyltransferase